jgi:hypothetical protein
MEDDAALTAIRREVHEAETIVFLGFAFHELNMELLSPEEPSIVKRFFGTAKGISDTDAPTVDADIRNMLKKFAGGPGINNKLKCCALFDEYWRSLSRAA